jgi:hypothetical protein
MTDAYSNDEADAPGTAEEADAPGGGAKLSQEEANYRRGTPLKHCGVCLYYEGEDDKSCSKVDGPISGFGLSDVFAMQKNPFGSLIGPQEARMITSMMASPPDQSAAVAPPRPQVRIGSRTY